MVNVSSSNDNVNVSTKTQYGPQGEDGSIGPPGPAGKSAYQVWLDLGNVGTEADFIASLKGPKGDTIHVEMVWAFDE